MRDVLVLELTLAGAVHASSNTETFTEQIATSGLADGVAEEPRAVEAASCGPVAVSTRPVIRHAFLCLCVLKDLLWDGA